MNDDTGTIIPYSHYRLEEAEKELEKRRDAERAEQERQRQELALAALVGGVELELAALVGGVEFLFNTKQDKSGIPLLSYTFFTS